MEWFRIAVGHAHGVAPRNIVGAIANEAGLDAQHIGRVNIDQEFSLVELPIGMPNDVVRSLKKVWVCGRTLNIVRMDADVSEKKDRSKGTRKESAARKTGSKKKSGAKKAPKRSVKKKTPGKKKR